MPMDMTAGAAQADDPAPQFDSTLERIVQTRQRNAEMRQAVRHDIERPPGPKKREVWRAVMRGEVPSVEFLSRFTQYRPMAYVRMPRGDLYFLNDPDLKSKMVEAGREYAKRFEASHVAQQYMYLYKSLT